jgi:hypothetical protein
VIKISPASYSNSVNNSGKFMQSCKINHIKLLIVAARPPLPLRPRILPKIDQPRAVGFISSIARLTSLKHQPSTTVPCSPNETKHGLWIRNSLPGARRDF